MKLNVKAFALTFALTWSILLFALTWWFIVFEGITNEITFIGKLYRGYNISPLGSLIGIIWAFFDGLIIGGLFAWIYNGIISKNEE